MKNCSLILLFMLTFNAHFSDAFIEWAIRWEKEENNIEKSILGLADRHLTTFSRFEELAKANFEQDNALLAFFSQQSHKTPNETKIILEDMSHYKGQNPMIQEYCDDLKNLRNPERLLKWQLLLNLGGTAQKYGLDMSNVEFHFARRAALSPLKPKLPTSTIIEEFDETANNIRSFNDGPILNQLYQEHLQAVEESSAAIRKQLNTFSGTMKKFLKKNIPKEKQPAFIRALRFFDVRLKDMLALHEIVTTEKKNILVIMGKGHIKMLDSFITRHLGYTKKSAIGQEDKEQKEYPTFNFEIESLPELAPDTHDSQDNCQPLPAEQLTAFLFEE